MPTPQPAVETVLALPTLPARRPDSNKGTFGRVLVVAGSRGMSGAAVLCGSAALRAGAGLVTVALPQSVWPVVAAGNPCLLTAPMPEDEAGRFSEAAQGRLTQLAATQDVLAVGPGLGRSRELSALVNVLLVVDKPLVLDADGLNALEGQTDRLRGRSDPPVLTPHPGEFARLLGIEIAAVQAQRQELAPQFAAEHKLVLVLKGHGTVVTDGRRLYVNTTGNAGMATAGTGDVLTGMIAALMGQGLPAFEAAQLGVHIHGLAGDLARDELGEVSLMATDLLEYLPRAFRKF